MKNRFTEWEDKTIEVEKKYQFKSRLAKDEIPRLKKLADEFDGTLRQKTGLVMKEGDVSWLTAENIVKYGRTKK